MDNNKLKQLHEIAEHYGLNAQLGQLQEECAELITAISHYKRGREGAKEEYQAELVDVEIMINQIKHLTQDYKQDRKEMREAKIKRQLERIKEDE